MGSVLLQSGTPTPTGTANASAANASAGGPVTTLPETISGALGLSGTLGDVVGGLIGAFLIANIMLGMTALAGPWAKRKITAAFTDRIAVNRIGPFGLLIIVADAVRLLSKELIVPDGVDRPAWDLAPIILPFSALLGFAVIPLGSGLQLADPETGIVFAFAAASVASLGLVMAGYASNNKYSLLGSLRSIAQNLAYEIPLVLTAASVILFAGTFRTSEIVAAQSETLVTIAGIAIPGWYAFVNPFAFVLFIAANMAEIGRYPLDIPDAPTALAAEPLAVVAAIAEVVGVGAFLALYRLAPSTSRVVARRRESVRDEGTEDGGEQGPA